MDLSTHLHHALIENHEKLPVGLGQRPAEFDVHVAGHAGADEQVAPEKPIPDIESDEAPTLAR